MSIQYIKLLLTCYFAKSEGYQDLSEEWQDFHLDYFQFCFTICLSFPNKMLAYQCS